MTLFSKKWLEDINNPDKKELVILDAENGEVKKISILLTTEVRKTLIILNEHWHQDWLKGLGCGQH